MTSLADIAATLPEPDELRRRLQILAMADAVLAGGSARHDFTREWREGHALASFENGGGDAHWTVFAPTGVYFQAFDHESNMSPYRTPDDTVWPGLVDDLPPQFRPFITDPDLGFLDPPSITLAFWRLTDDEAWRHGDIGPLDGEEPELSDWLIGPLAEWGDEVLDRLEYPSGRTDAIAHFLDFRPFSPEAALALNPMADVGALARTADRIGYPLPA